MEQNEVRSRVPLRTVSGAFDRFSWVGMLERESDDDVRASGHFLEPVEDPQAFASGGCHHQICTL